MKWIAATKDLLMQDDVVARLIKSKIIIHLDRVYKFTEHYLIMDNDFDAVGINGAEYYYEDIHVLDESETNVPMVWPTDEQIQEEADKTFPKEGADSFFIDPAEGEQDAFKYAINWIKSLNEKK